LHFQKENMPFEVCRAQGIYKTLTLGSKQQQMLSLVAMNSELGSKKVQ